MNEKRQELGRLEKQRNQLNDEGVLCVEVFTDSTRSAGGAATTDDDELDDCPGDKGGEDGREE